MLNAEGILFDPSDARAVRQGDRVSICVPAPTRSPRWHFDDPPRSRLLYGRVENPWLFVVPWLRWRADPHGSLAIFLAPHQNRTPEARPGFDTPLPMPEPPPSTAMLGLALLLTAVACVWLLRRAAKGRTSGEHLA